jgi:hypothetical protein
MKTTNKSTLLAIILMSAVDAVFAQNVLRDTAISIYGYLYATIGVVGAIAIVVMAINFKLNFIQNPMKQFLMTLLAVFLAFSAVGLVQYIKSVSSSQSIQSL